MLIFHFDNGEMATLKGYKLSELVEVMKKENTAVYDEHVVIFLSKVTYIEEVIDESEKSLQ